MPDPVFQQVAAKMADIVQDRPEEHHAEIIQLALVFCADCALRVGSSVRHRRLRPKKQQLVNALRAIANGGPVPAWMTVTMLKRTTNWILQHHEQCAC